MNEVTKINVATTAAAAQTSDVKETANVEVQSTEAKALDEAKTNENAEVSVEIAEQEAPKEEKQGFWSKLWGGIKSFFTGGDNPAGKAGEAVRSVTIGSLIGSILGLPIFGGILGLIFKPNNDEVAAAEEAPVEDVPAEEVPAEEVAAEEAPAEEAPVADVAEAEAPEEKEDENKEEA